MKTILFFTFAVVLLQFIEVDGQRSPQRRGPPQGPSPRGQREAPLGGCTNRQRPAIATPSPAIATPSPTIVTPSPAIATPSPAIATVRPAIATVRPAIATPRPAEAAPSAAIDATPSP